MNKKIISKRIANIKKSTDTELIKLELYGIVVDLILSKDEFPLNSNIADFFKELGITYKAYLLKSRTAMLGKIIRNIEKADEKQISIYLEVLETRMEIKKEDVTHNSAHKIAKKTRNKNNYMSDIMNKYRRDNNENL